MKLTVGLLFALSVLGQSTFYPVTPCRVVDTRGATGPFGGPALASGATRNIPIQTSPCLSGVTGQTAYSLNVTVVPTGILQYLTLWPSDMATMPVVSTLNSFEGQIVANAAVVKASAVDGSIDVFATDATHLIIDINGYYGPQSLIIASAQVTSVAYTMPSATEVDLTAYSGSTALPQAKLTGIAGTGIIYIWVSLATPTTLIAGTYGGVVATLTGLANGGVINDPPPFAFVIATITSMQGAISVNLRVPSH